MICDTIMSRKLKVKMKKPIMRAVLLYGRQEERLWEATEMRIFRRIKGVALWNREGAATN